MSMPLANPVRYVVVSPVRNEAEYLEQTIRDMVRQTVRPAQWVIVDDGSTDRTAEIIQRWASEHPWIIPVHRADTGLSATGKERANGPESGRNRAQRATEAKEIEAFYFGFERLTFGDWEFLVKLDGDLGFAPDYFDKCFEEFAADRRLGIGGGVICHHVKGRLQLETHPHFHVRGATKIYRRSCWEEIGGVIRGAGWDTLDEVQANRLGWCTRSFGLLPLTHYRFTGAANGAWHNANKNGRWSYIAGYHPLYMLVRCAKRIFRKPYVVGSLGLLYGFISAYLQQVPQTEDRGLIRYVREQQMRRLSLRPTIWR